MAPAITSAVEYAAAHKKAVAEATKKWQYGPREGWSPKSARQKSIVIDVHRNLACAPHEIELVYDIIYSMGSEALHAGIRGITRGVEVTVGTAVINHGARPPRPISGFLLLLYATHLYMKIMDNVNSDLGLKLESELQRLETEEKAISDPAPR